MELLILLPLGLMIISDFRCRRVLLWHLLLFGALQIMLSLYRLGVVVACQYILTNILVLFVIGCVLGLYVRFRFGKKKVMGPGDVLFIFLLSPHFGYRHFLYFLIISSGLTLITWLIYRYASCRESNEIPLISGLGICYFIVLIYQGAAAL